MEERERDKETYFLFVYYSGHGIESKGGVKCVPAKLDGAIYYYNLDELVLNLSKSDKSPIIISFFDCCREEKPINGDKISG
jgi:hypothetical protein